MKKTILTMAAVLVATMAQAEVRLPSIICDNMVVQRDVPVRVWGTADPGEQVTVTIDRAGKKGKKYHRTATVTAAAECKWLVELPALPLGNTYTIIVAGAKGEGKKVETNTLTVTGVVPGDVFLCSGQSNMELPVARVTDMFADEIAAYENLDIRQYKVPQTIEFHGTLDDTPASAWRSCTQDNVMAFSALGYFFAKQLYEQTGVPVGIINASWGGTPIEAWVSEESLVDYPLALNEKRLYEDDAYRAHIKRLEGENYAQWERVMHQGDPGMQSTVKWYAPDLDDSDWEVVDMFDTSWATDGLNPINGSHWFRKTVSLTASAAGEPAMLRLGCIVDADSVYVNGQFVGNITYQYPPRKYQVPAGVLKEGDNVVTVRLISQNGVPHFVQEKPYKLIVGDAEYSLEGQWRHRLGARMPHGPGMEFYYYKPTVLYNAMIHPLANVPLAGAVWYQGESNVDRRNQYADLLGVLMANWRETLGDDDLEFYIVELADFLHPSDVQGRAAWAEMRRQQAIAADKDAHAVLIKNGDLGEWNDIHPLDKKTLGARIAAAVRSEE